MALKLGVIGAGSTYTPELVEGFLQRAESIPLAELVLMDIDEEKLSIVGGLAQRMVQRAGSSKTPVGLFWSAFKLSRRMVSSASSCGKPRVSGSHDWPPSFVR